MKILFDNKNIKLKEEEIYDLLNENKFTQKKIPIFLSYLGIFISIGAQLWLKSWEKLFHILGNNIGSNNSSKLFIEWYDIILFIITFALIQCVTYYSVLDKCVDYVGKHRIRIKELSNTSAAVGKEVMNNIKSVITNVFVSDLKTLCNAIVTNSSIVDGITIYNYEVTNSMSKTYVKVTPVAMSVGDRSRSMIIGQEIYEINKNSFKKYNDIFSQLKLKIEKNVESELEDFICNDVQDYIKKLKESIECKDGRIKKHEDFTLEDCSNRALLMCFLTTLGAVEANGLNPEVDNNLRSIQRTGILSSIILGYDYYDIHKGSGHKNGRNYTWLPIEISHQKYVMALSFNETLNAFEDTRLSTIQKYVSEFIESDKEYEHLRVIPDAVTIEDSDSLEDSQNNYLYESKWRTLRMSEIIKSHFLVDEYLIKKGYKFRSSHGRMKERIEELMKNNIN